MISIKIDDKQVKKMLAELPKQASRAAEKALDFTAVRFADAIRLEMLNKFDRPTQFTLNSIKVTKTKGHNMLAKVGLKEPPRMADHYLVPQVEGGKSKRKGLDIALGGQFMPTRSVPKDSHGNANPLFIRRVLREVKAGNSKRYYFRRHGSKRTPVGVYQRVGKGRRALRPLFITYATNKSVDPQLDFYTIAQTTVDQWYNRKFNSFLELSLRF
jgi:hypothetical protein